MGQAWLQVLSCLIGSITYKRFCLEIINWLKLYLGSLTQLFKKRFKVFLIIYYSMWKLSFT